VAQVFLTLAKIKIKMMLAEKIRCGLREKNEKREYRW
jgi:hypothetical protein